MTDSINGPEAFNLGYAAAEDWETLYEMIKTAHLSDQKTYEDLVMDVEDVRLGEKSVDDLPDDLRPAVKNILAKHPPHTLGE